MQWTSKLLVLTHEKYAEGEDQEGLACKPEGRPAQVWCILQHCLGTGAACVLLSLRAAHPEHNFSLVELQVLCYAQEEGFSMRC
jgi:hypothetical protein